MVSLFGVFLTGRVFLGFVFCTGNALEVRSSPRYPLGRYQRYESFHATLRTYFPLCLYGLPVPRGSCGSFTRCAAFATTGRRYASHPYFLPPLRPRPVFRRFAFILPALYCGRRTGYASLRGMADCLPFYELDIFIPAMGRTWMHHL